jgi:hypothetical protein
MRIRKIRECCGVLSIDLQRWSSAGAAAEHAVLEPLAEALWAAQRAGRMPDEQRYLERLRTL